MLNDREEKKKSEEEEEEEEDDVVRLIENAQRVGYDSGEDDGKGKFENESEEGEDPVEEVSIADVHIIDESNDLSFWAEAQEHANEKRNTELTFLEHGVTLKMKGRKEYSAPMQPVRVVLLVTKGTDQRFEKQGYVSLFEDGSICELFPPDANEDAALRNNLCMYYNVSNPEVIDQYDKAVLEALANQKIIRSMSVPVIEEKSHPSFFQAVMKSPIFDEFGFVPHNVTLKIEGRRELRADCPYVKCRAILLMVKNVGNGELEEKGFATIFEKDNVLYELFLYGQEDDPNCNFSTRCVKRYNLQPGDSMIEEYRQAVMKTLSQEFVYESDQVEDIQIPNGIFAVDVDDHVPEALANSTDHLPNHSDELPKLKVDHFDVPPATMQNSSSADVPTNCEDEDAAVEITAVTPLPSGYLETCQNVVAAAKAESYTLPNTFLGDITYVTVSSRRNDFRDSQKILMDFNNDQMKTLVKKYDGNGPDLLQQGMIHGFYAYRAHVAQFFFAHPDKEGAKQKIQAAFFAPFWLHYHGCMEEVKKNPFQYHGKPVILLNLWLSRCDKPRVDIIIYCPWLIGEQRIEHLVGNNASKFLKQRYSVWDREYDVKEVFTIFQAWLKDTCRFFNGKIAPNTKDPVAAFAELRDMDEESRLYQYKRYEVAVNREFEQYNLAEEFPEALEMVRKFQKETAEKLKVIEERKKKEEQERREALSNVANSGVTKGTKRTTRGQKQAGEGSQSETEQSRKSSRVAEKSATQQQNPPGAQKAAPAAAINTPKKQSGRPKKDGKPPIPPKVANTEPINVISNSSGRKAGKQGATGTIVDVTEDSGTDGADESDRSKRRSARAMKQQEENSDTEVLEMSTVEQPSKTKRPYNRKGKNLAPVAKALFDDVSDASTANVALPPKSYGYDPAAMEKFMNIIASNMSTLKQDMLEQMVKMGKEISDVKQRVGIAERGHVQFSPVDLSNEENGPLPNSRPPPLNSQNQKKQNKRQHESEDEEEENQESRDESNGRDSGSVRRDPDKQVGKCARIDEKSKRESEPTVIHHYHYNTYFSAGGNVSGNNISETKK